jgi:hypothetical protein
MVVVSHSYTIPLDITNSQNNKRRVKICAAITAEGTFYFSESERARNQFFFFSIYSVSHCVSLYIHNLNCDRRSCFERNMFFLNLIAHMIHLLLCVVHDAFLVFFTKMTLCVSINSKLCLFWTPTVETAWYSFHTAKVLWPVFFFQFLQVSSACWLL